MAARVWCVAHIHGRITCVFRRLQERPPFTSKEEVSMTRRFLTFAVVFCFGFASLGLVGCGESAAVNKDAPNNGGTAPADGAADKESKYVSE